jgi:hypothetical protein
MITQIKKIIMQLKVLIPIVILCIFLSSLVFALSYNSTNYTMKNARIVTSAGKAASTDYSLTDVRIGSAFGGKTQSANYSLDATNIDKKIPLNPPSQPTVNSVTTPTNNPAQTLTGTKDSDTSIYINGYLVVPLDNQTTWSCNYTLVEGNNDLIITSGNKYNQESPSVLESIYLDTSSPTTPVVTDEGLYTSSTAQLYASWSSSDPQTGIIEYQYAIGTQAEGTDIVDWTSVGTQTEIIHSGLSLTQGRTYYFSVQAKNAAGSWSQIGSSDGITINQNIPTIIDIQPPNGSISYAQDTVDISVTAQDNDEDSLLYQFSIDATIRQSWSTSNTFSWNTAETDFGIHSIKVEVKDTNGAEVSQDIEICLFRKPLGPPLP